MAAADLESERHGSLVLGLEQEARAADQPAVGVAEGSQKLPTRLGAGGDL